MVNILKAGKKYIFSDYFELSNPTKEVVAEFGYTYKFEELNLPKFTQVTPTLTGLRHNYIKKLPFISLISETAKREFYIVSLLLELLDYLLFEINVEYPLDAGENLSGNIDYFLISTHNLIIVEAKKGDLERGFTQLAMELIALDKYIANSQLNLYGAITLGDVWRFGMLERTTHTLKKDINAYALLSDLAAILLGILEIGTLQCPKT